MVGGKFGLLCPVRRRVHLTLDEYSITVEVTRIHRCFTNNCDASGFFKPTTQAGAPNNSLFRHFAPALCSRSHGVRTGSRSSTLFPHFDTVPTKSLVIGCATVIEMPSVLGENRTNERSIPSTSCSTKVSISGFYFPRLPPRPVCLLLHHPLP